MKKLSFLLLLFAAIQLQAQIKITKLLCENLVNPIGVGTTQPQLSWQLSATARNTTQSAYELMVSRDLKDFSAKNIVWNTGKVSSDQSLYIVYAGKPLQSTQKYYWKVRVWDNKGKSSGWSTVASWQMGLLKTSEWSAKWIEPGYVEDSVLRPSPLFRKEFKVEKALKSATLFVTAHGLYEGMINGNRVGDAYFTPGWTSYNKRLQYQTYDISKYLKTGANAIGFTLASGWYRGELTWSMYKNIWGSKLGVLAQIKLEYTDGTTQNVITDENWKSSTGEIRYSELYHGEWIDHRQNQINWSTTGFNDNKWSGVKVAQYDNSNLVASTYEPPRKKEIFNPVKIFRTPKNELVVDFGQNLVGFVQIKLRGKAGDTVQVYHAEVLDKAGNFYIENLRDAKQKLVCILSGKGDENFEPCFTYMGFRYVRINNYNSNLKPEDIVAHAVYADMPPTGTFECSDTLINKLQKNIQWGQKGNFLEAPTDCPQRDERLGWTGDAQVFFRTGAFNMHIYNFFEKWMKDVAADQAADGSLPHTIPNVFFKYPNEDGKGSSGWADVTTIVPWDMYLTYGNTRILEEQYVSMKAWVDYISSKSENHIWVNGWHFGDWLSYAPDNDWEDRAARTDKQMIAQSFYVFSSQILANTAKVLNKTDDYKKYTALVEKTKEAFVREYVTPSSRIMSNTQTAYVLALHFDILPENMRAEAVKRLVENIHQYKNHLTTGFLGTPYLCHVLSRFGYTELAYKLLLNKDYPSWLYPVTQGATTIWERWDGQKPNGTFQDKGMNSFNHYAYGAIGDWMYRTVAGLNPDLNAPGYKRIIINPEPGGGFTHATASYQSGYGKITSGWQKINNKSIFNISIPCNTTAKVVLPAASVAAITEGNKPVNQQNAIKVISESGKTVVLEIGSGNYCFTVNN